MRIGECIKSLRLSAQLTQKQLADNVGVTHSLISHIEAGRREPTILLLRSIARFLGTPAAFLFAAAIASSEDSDPTEREATKHLFKAAEMLILAEQD